MTRTQKIKELDDELGFLACKIMFSGTEAQLAELDSVCAQFDLLQAQRPDESWWSERKNWSLREILHDDSSRAVSH